MKNIYSQFTDAMCLLSMEERRFTDCNQAALNLFEVDTLEQFCQTGPWDYSPDFQSDGEPSEPKALKMMTLALENGVHYFEWLHKTFKGNMIDCLILLNRIEIDGRVSLQVTCRDVSSEKRALRELRAKDYELSQVMAGISTSSLITTGGPDGSIVDANELFCQTMGFSREEIIGRSFQMFSHPDEDANQTIDIFKSVGQGQIWSGVIHNRKKNGDECFLRTVITPIHNQQGVLIKFLGIQTDVTAEVISERSLADAQRIAQMGSFVFRTDSIEVSENMYRIYQVPRNTAPKDLTETYMSRIHPEDMPQLNKALKRSFQTKADYFVIHRIQLPDGQIRHIECRGHTVDSNRGIAIVGTSLDITENVLRENRMQDLLNFKEAILHSAKVAIVTTDVNCIITGFNLEAERMFGYKPREVIGIHHPGLFHLPEEIAAAAEEFNREFGTNLLPSIESFTYKARQGIAEERQWNCVRKDGVRIPIKLMLTSLYDRDGKLYGFMGIGRDLTKEIEILRELELEKAKSLHHAKLASLGEMAAGVAHEINNPLAMISGTVDLLMKYKCDEQKFEAKTELIRKAAGRIEKIVKGLQKFSRASGKSDFQMMSLNSVVQEALILVENKSLRHSVPIRLCGTTKLNVRCDAVEIEQVIVNLLNNGIDAVKDRSERWVRLQLLEKNNSVVLQVIDSGDGIPQEIEQKLFQPFFTTKPVGEGTGLGLSIVKGILDQHGATIRVNRQFANTCFELTFPGHGPKTSEGTDAA